MRSSTEPTFEKTLVQRAFFFLLPAFAIAVAFTAYISTDVVVELARHARPSPRLGKILEVVRLCKWIMYAMSAAIVVAFLGIASTARAIARRITFAHDSHAALVHNLNARNIKVKQGLEEMRNAQEYHHDACTAAIEECMAIDKESRLNAEITRNYSSRGTIPGTPVDMAMVIDDVVDTERFFATSKDVSISWTPPAAKVVVSSHEPVLDSLVRNLVSNAVKYTPKGGRVSVSLATGATLLLRKPRATLVVSDTGIGMPKCIQRQIYERYYRADWKSDIPGTGLGLSLVRSIVVPCGGSIKCKSAPGKGTTFTVSLPLDTTKRPGFIRRFLGWC